MAGTPKAWILWFDAWTAEQLGDWPTAASLYEQAAAIFEEMGELTHGWHFREMAKICRSREGCAA